MCFIYCYHSPFDSFQELCFHIDIFISGEEDVERHGSFLTFLLRLWLGEDMLSHTLHEGKAFVTRAVKNRHTSSRVEPSNLSSPRVHHTQRGDDEVR